MKNQTLIYHHRTQAVDAQGIHIYEMCSAFRRLGWKVKMVSLVSDEAVGKEAREGFFYELISKIPKIIYEVMEIGYGLIGICRLWRAVVHHKPKFIYERYSIYNFAGAVVSRITGVPLIVEVNAPLAKEKREYERLYFPHLAQRVETAIVNNSFRTIAVTRVLRRILIENGAKEDKIVVMYNGVNPQEYRQFGDEMANRQNRTSVGFIGWFRNWHGLREIIQTMGKSRWDSRGVNLLLVGDGPARPEIEKLIEEYNLGGAVTITGEVDRAGVRKFLAEMDIALQPAATTYACPMKLIEYMAAGKAIIAPNQPNIQELLTHEENGLLFETQNWTHLTQQMERLLQNRDLMLRIGSAAKETVQKRRLTWEENARRVLALL